MKQVLEGLLEDNIRKAGALTACVAAFAVAGCGSNESEDAGYRAELSGGGQNHIEITFPESTKAKGEEHGVVVCVDNYKPYKSYNGRKVRIRLGEFIVPSSLPNTVEVDLSGEGDAIDRCNIFAPVERDGELEQIKTLPF